MAPCLSIEPNAVYDEGTIALALGLSLASLASARKSGALRYVRKGRRVLILGRSLLSWLEPPQANPIAGGTNASR